MPLVTREPTLKLTGTLSDERRLKDVFVFVNDKKVFFRSLETLAVGEQGVKTPIEVPLPLKVGENGVAIVVRESKDLVSRVVLGVYREPAEAVAEVPAKKATAQ